MKWEKGARVEVKKGPYAARVGIVQNVNSDGTVEVKIGWNTKISTPAENLKEVEMEA